LVGVAFGGGGDQRCGELLAWAASAADRFPDLHFVVSLPPLMSGELALGERVSTITRSPLADVWGAFDFVISAAGYNSTHELLHAGVPTIFVPLERPLDDQFARAAHFADRGAALSATAFDGDSLDRAVASLSNAEARAAMASKALAAGAGEGAALAAEHLLDLAH
jgi:UDP-N-acetylglucosamine:LPS N-acetylglucosamine transferase